MGWWWSRWISTKGKVPWLNRPYCILTKRSAIIISDLYHRDWSIIEHASRRQFFKTKVPLRQTRALASVEMRIFCACKGIQKATQIFTINNPWRAQHTVECVEFVNRVSTRVSIIRYSDPWTRFTNSSLLYLSDYSTFLIEQHFHYQQESEQHSSFLNRKCTNWFQQRALLNIVGKLHAYILILFCMNICKNWVAADGVLRFIFVFEFDFGFKQSNSQNSKLSTLNSQNN